MAENIVLLKKYQKKTSLFIFYRQLQLSLKTFKPILLSLTGIKNMEITIAAINYIRKYQLNFCQIVGSKITFGYRPDNSLYLYNTKKILFCSLIEPCQAQTLNFKCTWLLNYLEMYFMFIRAHANQKTWSELFLEFFYLTGLLNSLSNKVIQIKSFFYKVLLTQLSFPTNIPIYINSQSKFVFIQHSIICQKHWPYSIFRLLEGNKRYM